VPMPRGSNASVVARSQLLVRGRRGSEACDGAGEGVAHAVGPQSPCAASRTASHALRVSYKGDPPLSAGWKGSLTNPRLHSLHPRAQHPTQHTTKHTNIIMPLPQLPYKRPFFSMTLSPHEIEVRGVSGATWLVPGDAAGLHASAPPTAAHTRQRADCVCVRACVRLVIRAMPPCCCTTV
jgi:hypothetical protein